MGDPAVEAIKYALEKCEDCYDSVWFLRLWNEGDFESIREEYEDVPDEIFIGADSLFKSPAHIEDGEEVEVVGWRISSEGFGSYLADSALHACPDDARERLMTVAQHQRIVAALSAPPASEQQRAVVMPEGFREAMGKAASSWLYENDPQGLDWCDPRNVDALLDALFEAAPHLAKGEGV